MNKPTVKYTHTHTHISGSNIKGNYANSYIPQSNYVLEEMVIILSHQHGNQTTKDFKPEPDILEATNYMSKYIIFEWEKRLI